MPKGKPAIIEIEKQEEKYGMPFEEVWDSNGA